MIEKIQKEKSMNADNIANCRVIEIGIGDFAECAQWGPVTCEHAMPLGSGYLCMHPRLDDIIKNTRKVLLAEKI